MGSDNKLDLVVGHLRKLSESYFKLEENVRGGTFSSAATSIRDFCDSEFNGSLPPNLDAINNLRGIGGSTMKEITEVLNTGTSRRLDELTKRLESEEKSDLKVTSISGLKSMLGGK